jgi:hypothetical protein
MQQALHEQQLRRLVFHEQELQRDDLAHAT